MITHAMLQVLNRMAAGETLYSGKGRAFFHTRLGGTVHPRLLQVLLRDKLIAPGEKIGLLGTYKLTEAGIELQKNPPITLDPLKFPRPNPAWFARIQAKIEGLGDAKLSDLPMMMSCWVWKGSCNTAGYPFTSIQSKHITLHRFLYELTFGPLPEGSRLKNRQCRNPRCVNPYHWEDNANVRGNEDSARSIFARVMHAANMGGDPIAILEEWREKLLSGSPTVPVPVLNEEEIDLQDVIDLVENLYGRHQCASFEELWNLIYDPEQPPELQLCSREMVAEAVRKIGGIIADRCNPNP